MDDRIAQFADITGATPEQAQFFLQSANGDLETAMSTFYESGGAQGTVADGQASVHDDDDDKDGDDGDEATQGLLSGSTSGGLSSQASGSGQTLGGQTLGGGPVPATTTTTSSSTAAPAPKKKNEIRTTGGRKFGTLGSTIRQQAESDDEADKAQNFYTGGEKSGLSVEDPNKKKKKKDNDGGDDAPNDMVKRLLKKAAEGSEARQEREQEEAKKPASSSFFGGSGNVLGSEDTPSATTAEPPVPSTSNPAAQGSGGLSSMLPQLRNLFGRGGPSAADVNEEGRELPEDYEAEVATRQITLWRDGFSVEDGPLLRYDEPRNMETLRTIQDGTAPTSVLNVRFGQRVELHVAKRTGEAYIAPPPKPMKPFSGGGNRLGAPTPAAAPSASTSTPASASAPAPAQQGTSEGGATFEVDGTKPVTTLQIRLGDGTRQTARFNHDHTIGDIRNWLNAANPGMAARSYVLMTTFPSKDLADPAQTIKDAGALGSVVVQRWT